MNPAGTRTCRIGGRVTFAGGSGLSGVTVRLTGGVDCVHDHRFGNYAFSSLAEGGSYIVTPERTGFTMQPVNRMSQRCRLTSFPRISPPQRSRRR